MKMSFSSCSRKIYVFYVAPFRFFFLSRHQRIYKYSALFQIIQIMIKTCWMVVTPADS